MFDIYGETLVNVFHHLLFRKLFYPDPAPYEELQSLLSDKLHILTLPSSGSFETQSGFSVSWKKCTLLHVAAYCKDDSFAIWILSQADAATAAAVVMYSGQAESGTITFDLTDFDPNSHGQTTGTFQQLLAQVPGELSNAPIIQATPVTPDRRPLAAGTTPTQKLFCRELLELQNRVETHRDDLTPRVYRLFGVLLDGIIINFNEDQNLQSSQLRNVLHGAKGLLNDCLDPFQSPYSCIKTMKRLADEAQINRNKAITAHFAPFNTLMMQVSGGDLLSDGVARLQFN